MYFWATVAFRLKQVPGATAPMHDEARPPYNPEGFSTSTTEAVLDAAGPGGTPCVDYIDMLLTQQFGAGIDGLHSEANPLSVTALLNRGLQLNYSNNSHQATCAAMREGAYLVDLLSQNFKSYQACAVCACVHARAHERGQLFCWVVH